MKKFIILIMLFISLSLYSQELSQQLQSWEVPVEIEKEGQNYKIIDSDSTSFNDVAYSISYLMTVLEFVLEDENLEADFNINYLFVDREGKMWSIHLDKNWIDDYIHADKREKDDLIHSLTSPYEIQQQSIKNKRIEDEIKSLR